MKYLIFSPIVVETLFKDNFTILFCSLQLLLIKFHKYFINSVSNVVAYNYL